MRINLVCITSILGRQQLEIVRGDGWFLFEYIYIWSYGGDDQSGIWRGGDIILTSESTTTLALNGTQNRN